MITALFGDLIPYIVMALTAVGAIWGYGRLEKRKGAKERDAKRDAADAKETIKAHEVRDEVEADIARRGDAKQRLREDWRRK